MTRIIPDPSKRWLDVEAHKTAFGHLPDESCKSSHPLECNRSHEALPSADASGVDTVTMPDLDNKGEIE